MQSTVMPGDPQTSYEDVPYESKPLYPTHPSRLAAVAALYGLTPPDLEHCRVLEIGCAGGGNLVPMAEAYPGARFLGIDLSPGQIAEGQNFVRALGLANIELQALDILDLDDRFGQFDFILCHGVWSWVPGPVRDHILTVCGRNLSPHGVAYVSYNTYPGWYARGMVRQVLAFHARRYREPQEQIRQARSFLDFLTGCVREPDGPYGQVLRREAELLRDQADSYLFHEHLEDVNQPVFFHEFIDRAKVKGLQYLDEAQGTTLASCFSADIKETLRQMTADPVELEQYFDLLGNRTFRRTLLCRQEAPVRREPSAESLRRLKYASNCRPKAEVDLRPDTDAKFVTTREVTLTTSKPLVKAVLVMLGERSPLSLSFEEVLRRVRGRLGSAGPDELAQALLHCLRSGIVEIFVQEPRFVTTVSPTPKASPLARHQAATGCPWIANRRHRIVTPDGFDRAALALLDGSRDRAALIAELSRHVCRGELELPETGRSIREPAAVRPLVETALAGALPRLAGQALLIG